jgi:ABC-type uncharacterized transport system substrate-binding protein
LTIDHFVVPFDTPKLATVNLIKMLSKTTEPHTIFAPNGITALVAREAVERSKSDTSIFFSIHSDPIALGFAKSFGTPGGIMTGFTYDYARQNKLIETIRTIDPRATTYGLLVDKFIINETPITAEFQKTAESHGLRTTVVDCEDGHFRPKDLAELCRRQGIHAWIAIDTGPFQDHHETILSQLAKANAFLVTNDIDLLKKGALAAVEPVIESPYEVWARQFEIMMSGYPIGQIPIEQPTVFRRGFNLDVAERLGVKLSRRQLASFDVLYTERYGRM